MRTLFIVLFSFLAAQSKSAQTTIQPTEIRSVIVDNLTIGIKYDNTGLHISSVLVLYDQLINFYQA